MEYKLYIGRLQTLPEEVEYTYYSSENGYLLAYHNESIEDMQEIPERNYAKLSTDERSWLIMCKVAINTKAMADNTKEYTAMLEEFLIEFENSLASAQKEKENGK